MHTDTSSIVGQNNNDSWARDAFARLHKKPSYKAGLLSLRITEQLNKRMIKLGMTQSELARKLEKPQPFISRIFNEGTNMTLKTLVSIADALGLEVDVPQFTEKTEIRPDSEEQYSSFDEVQSCWMQKSHSFQRLETKLTNPKHSYSPKFEKPDKGNNNDYSIAA